MLPVPDLLLGASRNHVECYGTTFLPPSGPESAAGAAPPAMAGRLWRARGPRWMPAIACSASMPRSGPVVDNVLNTHERVRLVASLQRDSRRRRRRRLDDRFSSEFDFADALRCCRLIEDYEPFFVEDPVRDEQALEEIPKLRLMTTCPLAHGEEWGQRWDFHARREQGH